MLQGIPLSYFGDFQAVGRKEANFVAANLIGYALEVGLKEAAEEGHASMHLDGKLVAWSEICRHLDGQALMRIDRSVGVGFCA